MSHVWRGFEMLIIYSGDDEYKTQHRLVAMGVRKDGAVVFSCNGHSFFPPRQRLIIKMAHAEQRLARKLDRGAEVFVARIKRDGSFGLSAPCSSCRRLLKSRGVSRCFYTISNQDYGVIDF